MSEPDLFILGERKRGRPKAPEPRSVLSVWMLARHHDRLIALAQQREVSVSRLVSSLLGDAIEKAAKR